MLATDVLVVGGGIAGCCAALAAAAEGAHVLLISKTQLEEANTAYAQGGLAAVLQAADSVEQHCKDTLTVGAGLSRPEVVRRVIAAGGSAVSWLQSLGASFDVDAAGNLLLSREAGHSLPRVVHAHGDSTGAEIQRALGAQVQGHPRVLTAVGSFARDLLVDDGGCRGAVVVEGDGRVIAITARATIVATGGAGQVYRETTNPIGACGDGVALAFRAGARVAGMEFVQFHPTTLYIAGAARSLISEVVRGAGATLRDRNGVRFMADVHPDAELAPRDVVSRAILRRMVETGDTNVYLDLSTVRGNPRQLFPSIARICSAFDFDITREPIPVRPGAHYFVGGVVTDPDGRSTLPGLWAVGEASCSGLHGANRLASNSLLEGAVLGRACGAAAAGEVAGRPQPRARRVDGLPLVPNAPKLHHDDMLYSLKSLMWRQVGLERDRARLQDALKRIAYWNHHLLRCSPRAQKGCELANMLTVSALVATSALQRIESRGTHYRTDHAERDDASWCRDVELQRAEDGSIGLRLGALVAPSDEPCHV